LSETRNILVAPLDWGLGHATRCIPIIRLLQKKGVTVILASNGESAILLQQEFPKLKMLTPPDYAISYPKNGNMALKMVFSSSKILTNIKKEHIWLENIIEKNNISAVISDNRYGLWSKKAHTIFITHQLQISTGNFSFLQFLINRINNRLIQRFDEIWVPDFENIQKIAGKLSTPTKRLKTEPKYIGILSRFSKENNKTAEKNHILAIVSGPEPQRKYFEELLIKQLSSLKEESILLSGKPSEKAKPKKIGNLTILPHANISEFQKLISEAKIVISRPGYSTIMDLARFGKKAFFIPTPGQTEQIYLAKTLLEQKMCYSTKQKNLDLKTDIPKAEQFKGIAITTDENMLLEKEIDKLLKII